MTNDDDRTRLDPRPWGGQQRILPRHGFKPVASRVEQLPDVVPGERARRITALPGLPPERPSVIARGSTPPPVRGTQSSPTTSAAGTPTPARSPVASPTPALSPVASSTSAPVVRARGTKPPPIPLAALLPRPSAAALSAEVQPKPIVDLAAGSLANIAAGSHADIAAGSHADVAAGSLAKGSHADDLAHGDDLAAGSLVHDLAAESHVDHLAAGSHVVLADDSARSALLPIAPRPLLSRYALPLTIAVVALVLVARYLIQS